MTMIRNERNYDGDVLGGGHMRSVESMIYSWKIFSQVCVLFLWVATVQLSKCSGVCVFVCLRVTCVQFTKQEPLCSHIADADVNLTIAISLTVIGADCPNCRTPLIRIFLYLSADRASQQ